MQQTFDQVELKFQEQKGEDRLGTKGKGEKGLRTDIHWSLAIHQALHWVVSYISFILTPLQKGINPVLEMKTLRPTEVAQITELISGEVKMKTQVYLTPKLLLDQELLDNVLCHNTVSWRPTSKRSKLTGINAEPTLKFKKSFAQKHHGDLVTRQPLLIIKQPLLPYISIAFCSLESPFTY